MQTTMLYNGMGGHAQPQSPLPQARALQSPQGYTPQKGHVLYTPSSPPPRVSTMFTSPILDTPQKQHSLAAPPAASELTALSASGPHITNYVAGASYGKCKQSECRCTEYFYQPPGLNCGMCEHAPLAHECLH